MEELIEKFKGYKLVHINTINDECYELILSNEDMLYKFIFEAYNFSPMYVDRKKSQSEEQHEVDFDKER